MTDNHMDMNRLQQDAIRRAREMQSRAKFVSSPLPNQTPQSQPTTPKQPVSPQQTSKPPVPPQQTPKPPVPPQQTSKPPVPPQQTSKPPVPPQQTSKPPVPNKNKQTNHNNSANPNSSDGFHMPPPAPAVGANPNLGQNSQANPVKGIFDSLFSDSEHTLLLVLILLLVQEKSDSGLIFALMYLVL